MTRDHDPAAPTPEALFARWRAERDPEALGLLFDGAAPGLFRLALSLVPDAATAEDALQETFLFAMQEADRWDPARPVVPWLAGILRLKVLEARRRHARAPSPERLRRPPAPDDPLEQASDAEERERVRLALLDLEEPYREAALLRWRYGLEPAEIAEVKGVPPGTVSSWLHRAVEKLRIGMGALPAVLAGAFPERGLSVVKAEVMRASVAKALAATAGAGGGIVATKTVIGLAAACVLGLAGWWALGAGGGGGASTAGGAGTAPPSPGSDTRGSAPGPRSASKPPSGRETNGNPGPAGPSPSGGGGTADPGAAVGTSAPAFGAPPAGDAPAGSAPGAPGVDDTATAASRPAVLPPYDPAQATATLRIRAKAAGTLPRMRAIRFDADPKCGEQHKEAVPDPTIVADADGRLANVVAWVSAGADRWSFPTPAEPVLIDQKGCMYSPHVLTLMVGQPLAIRNSDPCMHNVHAVPQLNEEFNRSQLKGAADLSVRFGKEEVGMKVKCDVHGWMGAWIGAFAHPFHGVTGADGTVEIRVPPGAYEVSGWHEYRKFPRPEPRRVTVAAGETAEVEFVFEVK